MTSTFKCFYHFSLGASVKRQTTRADHVTRSIRCLPCQTDPQAMFRSVLSLSRIHSLLRFIKPLPLTLDFLDFLDILDFSTWFVFKIHSNEARKMVRTYYEEDQLPFRRYSARIPAYTISDRDLPSNSNNNLYARSQYVGVQESHNDHSSPSRDELPRTRSRIPVACGRCRKRKIRCSGDNGGPCTNCKTAGNELCQFLRVASTETTMIKNEAPVSDFDYSSASSRMNCRLVPCAPHYHTINSAPLSNNTYTSYRNNPLNYQFPLKHLYPLPNYAETGEEHVDYGLALQLNTYQGDQLSIGSNYNPAPVRTWASTPQLKSLPFLDPQSPVYNHGQSPYNTTSFDNRPNLSLDSKPLQMANVQQGFLPQSLPAPINTGMDRMLPVPAPNRMVQINQFLAANDALIAGAHPARAYSDYNHLQTLKSDSSNETNNCNANAATDGNGNFNYHGSDSSSSTSSGSNHSTPENSSMPTTYTPLTTQSPESLSSAQTSYSKSSFSLPASQKQQQTVYTPPHQQLMTSNESSGAYDHGTVPSNDNNGTLHERLRLSDSGSYHSGSNSPNGYGNYDYSSNDRRGSHVSQASQHRTSVSSQGGYPHSDDLPPISNGRGVLANGHTYYPASSNPYPVPAIDVQPTQPRRPSGVLA